MEAYTCSPSTPEAEAGGLLQDQGQLGLCGELKYSLNYTETPCFKTKAVEKLNIKETYLDIMKMSSQASPWLIS